MNPLIVLISGPSGVGKDSVINKLRDDFNSINVIITATTRTIRAGEINGRDYIFVDQKDFERMKKANEFLEYANVYGNQYGVPKDQVKAALSRGQDALIKADVQGASTIKKKVDGSILIFIKPPSTLDLEKRLKKRHTEDEAELNLRLATAKEELSKIDIFDYIVVNDDVIEASEEIKRIIYTQRCNQYRTKIKIL